MKHAKLKGYRKYNRSNDKNRNFSYCGIILTHAILNTILTQRYIEIIRVTLNKELNAYPD